MRKMLLATGTFALCLQACATELTVQKQGPSQVSKGLPYELYFDQFVGKVTYRLADCKDMKIAVTAAIDKQVGQSDPTHQYFLDPNDLAAFAKTADVALEYHPDGSVKSLNASVEDRSVEIVSSLVKTGVGIASLAATGMDLPAGGVCSAAAAEALKKYEASIGELKSATALKKQAQQQFDAIKKKIAALGTTVDPDTQREYRIAFDLLAARTAELKAALGTVGKDAKPITHVVSFRLPGNGNDMGGIIHSFDRKTYARDIWRRWGRGAPPGDDIVWQALQVTWKITPDQVRSRPKLGSDFKGIPFRTPANGRFIIEQPNKKRTPLSQALPHVLLSKEARMSQLGRIFLLECKSPMFTSGGCSLGFDEKRNLVSGGAKRTNAPGESLAGAASDTVQQLAEARKSRLQSVKDIEELKDAIEDLLEDGADAAEDAEVSQTEAALEIRVGQQSLEEDAGTNE